MKDRWSDKTSKYFCSLTTGKVLRTSLVSYHIGSDKYLIDLFENNVSVSKLLLDGNHARRI